MKKFSLQPEARVRYLLALVSGVLLAMAFPKFSVAGFAWIAPGLLLFSGCGADGKRAFRAGYLGGLALNLTALYWLVHMPVPIAPIFAWLALSAYLALYPAIWVWGCWKLFPKSVEELPAIEPFEETDAGPERWLPPKWLGDIGNSSWLQRGVWALVCTTLWVGLEMIMGRFLTGFPWLLVGVSQYALTPLIQLASYTGVGGISFLVVWVSVSMMCGLAVILARRKADWQVFAEVRVPLIVLLIITCAGLFRILKAPTRESPEVKLALVQPSIPQTVLWDPREVTNRFDKLIQLSEAALVTKPQILVWPEAALPAINESMFRTIVELVRSNHVWLVFGGDDRDERLEDGKRVVDYFNAALIMNPDGKIEDVYHKRRLVIFGEYIPLVRWLPFLRYVTPIGDGLAAGTKPGWLRTRDPAARMGMLICFEDAFPQSARDTATDETDFLVDITNDGWFSESAAQWQHAANASFRAVENGLPLVRCANNGLTCWVDAFGRMRGVPVGTASDIYGAGFKVVSIPLLAAGEKRQPTFYRQHGDWFGWGCVLISMALMARRWLVNL